MNNYEKMAKEYGTVNFHGIELALIQDAYIDTDFSLAWQPDVYFATAIDEEENEYHVKWEIIDENTDDESNACDWDNPSSVERF